MMSPVCNPIYKNYNLKGLMFITQPTRPRVVKRVRAILLTGDGKIMFIKRVKPNVPPYWVAPGGGVENEDHTLLETLNRELHEELGATFSVLREAFILEHEKAGKQLEEHFFICKLHDYDLSLRCGPEFDDPSRGEFLPDAVEINKATIAGVHIKTVELANWLMENTRLLKRLAR